MNLTEYQISSFEEEFLNTVYQIVFVHEKFPDTEYRIVCCWSAVSQILNQVQEYENLLFILWIVPRNHTTALPFNGKQFVYSFA